MQKRGRAVSWMGRRSGIAPLVAAGALAVLALAVAGCDDGGFETCKYTIDDVPNGAACAAIVAKQECGVNSCTGLFGDVPDQASCTALADADFCPANAFDDATETCQIAGCPCTGFVAETVSCFMQGCRTCGALCAYTLTAVADLQSCRAQALALDCVSVVGFDEATSTCSVVGCSVCVDGAVVTSSASQAGDEG